MVDEAVAFAMKAHEGAFRKGTRVPYIVHPLETAVIVSMMSEDEEDPDSGGQVKQPAVHGQRLYGIWRSNLGQVQ